MGTLRQLSFDGHSSIIATGGSGGSADVIHYATKEEWNNQLNLIGEQGHLYVYSNYTLDENSQNVPAIKVGDGTSYLIDLPIVTSGVQESSDYIDLIRTHIDNQQIHVSQNDRTSWDNKVSVEVDDVMESIVFS